MKVISGELTVKSLRGVIGRISRISRISLMCVRSSFPVGWSSDGLCPIVRWLIRPIRPMGYVPPEIRMGGSPGLYWKNVGTVGGEGVTTLHNFVIFYM